MPFTDKEIIAQKENGIVTVTLNRPEALNALTLEMVRLLSFALSRWEKDDKVKAVVFRGAGDRAFCAGGDVKATYALGMRYRRGMADERIITLFYAEEYRLNRQLFHYKKPLFVFMNGITMGGGFGIAGPCHFRIATEKTVLSMPETNIGFFPDVGSTWFLNRCPGETGAYLALTGNPINADDAAWSELATHLIPSSSLQSCMDAIEKKIQETSIPEALEDALKDLSVTPAKGDLQKNRQRIDECFKYNTIEDILAALNRDGSDWAKKTSETIQSRSPTSLKISLAHLRQGKTDDFNTIIARDFILAQHFMKGHDFYEGVRAALIDKDKSPHWDPTRLSDVTDETLKKYFAPADLDLDEMVA